MFKNGEYWIDQGGLSCLILAQVHHSLIEDELDCLWQYLDCHELYNQLTYELVSVFFFEIDNFPLPTLLSGDLHTWRRVFGRENQQDSGFTQR